SRRRHTRSKRDWSSDVCSSDLTVGTSQSMATEHGAVPIGDVVSLAVAFEWAMQVAEGNLQPNASVSLDAVERHVVGSDPEHEARSEERRVGKERRTRRSQKHCD